MEKSENRETERIWKGVEIGKQRKDEGDRQEEIQDKKEYNKKNLFGLWENNLF
jgi:hypothetical protein